MLRRVLPLLALFGLALAAPAAAEDEPRDFKADKAAYQAWMERPSLYMRHKGRIEFAQTHDVRALRVLAKSYGRPEAPKDQVQYLLASICGDNFRAPPHLEVWRTWRKKHAKPRDAWLWYRALEADLHIDGSPETVSVVRKHSTGALRAAALEVLIASEDPAALTLSAELLAALPTKGFDRMLLLESAAQALYVLRAQRGSDAWKKTLELLKVQLDAKPTLERTRAVIARRLGRIEGAMKPVELGRYAPPTKPTFLGLEASGSRVVYVIDMSDSMLTPLTKAEIEDLKKPPRFLPPPPKPGRVVTGGNLKKKPQAPKPTPAQKEMADAIARLPWPLIITRFDAAREFVKLSLRALTPRQSFCVIGFGSEAKLLAATPGLKPAIEKHVEKACVELDVIEAGKETRARPYGTLWGYTNLHGGLHRAFKVRSKGLVKQHEYVDPATFTEGCDTIFLLSDGKPTWDDWPAWDRRLAKHKSGDPESGAEVQDHEKGHYYGPYALASWLRDDVRRLNLFRKAEVHCVGIGEHDPHLLRFISGQGLGRFRRIPARK
ncbi:MAG: hypothetical protein P1V36_10220 [Planctomycetota bacterium]|nr:hypothetical protein [Planctomycetota bacterium]